MTMATNTNATTPATTVHPTTISPSIPIRPQSPSFRNRRRRARLRRLWNTCCSLFFPEVCQCCQTELASPRLGYTGRLCLQKIQRIEPPFCQLCGLPFKATPNSVFQCENCTGQTLHFHSARALIHARGVARELIHAFKYHRALWLHPLFQRWIRSSHLPLLQRDSPPSSISASPSSDTLSPTPTPTPASVPSSWNAIIPIPLHRLKERERGYNQAEVLASIVASHLHAPLQIDWLQRANPTPSQTRLSRAERARNVAEAFSVTPRCPPHPGRILLVDDVLTTGATASACAQQLLRAGATEVHVFTLARGV